MRFFAVKAIIELDFSFDRICDMHETPWIAKD